MIRALAFAFFGFGLLSASANEGASSKTAELDVLSRYVGDWNLAFDADDPFSRGTLTAEWTLDGAYLEQQGQLTARFVPKDVKIRTLTTYDADTKQYKRWAFLSNGRRMTYAGTWDSKTSTMVWESERLEAKSGQTVRTKSTEAFRDEDTIEISKVSVSSGREIGRSTELRTRRK